LISGRRGGGIESELKYAMENTEAERRASTVPRNVERAKRKFQEEELFRQSCLPENPVREGRRTAMEI